MKTCGKPHILLLLLLSSIILLKFDIQILNLLSRYSYDDANSQGVIKKINQVIASYDYEDSTSINRSSHSDGSSIIIFKKPRMIQFHSIYNTSVVKYKYLITERNKNQTTETLYVHNSPIDFRAKKKSKPCEEYLHLWMNQSFPTCNIFHEIDIAASSSNSLPVEYKASGSIRLAWSVRFDYFNNYHSKNILSRDVSEIEILNQIWSNSTLDPPLILKTLRVDDKFHKEFKNRREMLPLWEQHRVDAISMERLTISPHIVNIYGNCGHSVLNEYGIDMDSVIKYFYKHGTSLDQLTVALQSIKAIADVHDQGIVHNDIKTFQFLLVNKKVKLNDFNKSVLLRKRSSSNSTQCPFYNKISTKTSRLRSPEEYLQMPLRLSADIYAFGNILYAILIGKRPYDKNKNMEARSFIMNGTKPYLSSKVRISKDVIVQTLVESLNQCYEFHPEDRPTAHEIVNRFYEKYKSIKI